MSILIQPVLTVGWKEYRIQMIGAGLLILSWCLWLMPRLSALAVIALSGALIIDLYVMNKKLETISAWIQKLFIPKIDLIILIAIYVFTIWWVWNYWTEPILWYEVALGITLGPVKGHLFWNGN